MNRFRNISWTTIILVCIFCFPAGVVLAILKETTPKIRSKRKRNKKRVNALKVWGWILTVIGAICFIPAVTENIQDIWVGIVIAAGGIAGLCSGLSVCLPADPHAQSGMVCSLSAHGSYIASGRLADSFCCAALGNWTMAADVALWHAGRCAAFYLHRPW